MQLLNIESLCVYLQPGGEELLELLENGCSSTINTTEVNVSEEEARDNDPQSNDQVVPIDSEECRDEHDRECLLQDPEGNDITQKSECDCYYGYINFEYATSLYSRSKTCRSAKVWTVL